MLATRITVDLENPNLVKLLSLEAQSQGITKRKVIIQALENYFAEKMENKALMKMAEATFLEWDNPLDRDYDKL